MCTVDFHRGRLASDMGEDMDTTLTDAIEKGKRAEAIEMAKGEDMDTIATDVFEKGKRAAAIEMAKRSFRRPSALWRLPTWLCLARRSLHTHASMFCEL